MSFLLHGIALAGFWVGGGGPAAHRADSCGTLANADISTWVEQDGPVPIRLPEYMHRVFPDDPTGLEPRVRGWSDTPANQMGTNGLVARTLSLHTTHRGPGTPVIRRLGVGTAADTPCQFPTSTGPGWLWRYEAVGTGHRPSFGFLALWPRARDEWFLLWGNAGTLGQREDLVAVVTTIP